MKTIHKPGEPGANCAAGRACFCSAVGGASGSAAPCHSTVQGNVPAPPPCCLRTHHPAVWDGGDGDHLVGGVGSKLVGNHHVGGQHELDALGLQWVAVAVVGVMPSGFEAWMDRQGSKGLNPEIIRRLRQQPRHPQTSNPQAAQRYRPRSTFAFSISSLASSSLSSSTREPPTLSPCAL